MGFESLKFLILSLYPNLYPKTKVNDAKLVSYSMRRTSKYVLDSLNSASSSLAPLINSPCAIHRLVEPLCYATLPVALESQTLMGWVPAINTASIFYRLRLL